MLSANLRLEKIYDNIQTHRSNIARHAIEHVTAYIAELTKDEVKKWAVVMRATRLGELIYAEPCPPGYSLVKGAANFRVRLVNLVAMMAAYRDSS